MSKPRILLVTRNFPPLVGGMERLMYELYRELLREFELVLVGPAGAQNFVSQDTPVFTCPPLPLSRFLLQIQLKAAVAAQRFRPSLVVAGSGLIAPAAWVAARLTGAKALCYLHGLDLAVDNALYQTVFIPFIRRFDRAIVNSRHTQSLAAASGVDQSRLRLLHPGVTVPQTASEDRLSFRRRLGIDADAPLLLSVGRLNARKGLPEFIENSLPFLVARHQSLKLLIVGSESTQALKRGNQSVQERIRAVAVQKGLVEHIVMLGGVDDELLSQAYRASDVFVFPLLALKGDVEGFGMVAVEAAAHGLPVVAFSVGGVVDAVKPGVSGDLIAPGHYTAFADAILRLISSNVHPVIREACREFARGFSWECFGKSARNLCFEVLG